MPSLMLEPDLHNVGVARAFAIDTTEDRLSEPALEDVVMMVSELVTNVFVHARTRVTLTVRLGPPLRVEVADHAAATSAFREVLQACQEPDPAALSGRGLCIVQALAARVGLDVMPEGGKVIWFEA